MARRVLFALYVLLWSYAFGAAGFLAVPPLSRGDTTVHFIVGSTVGALAGAWFGLVTIRSRPFHVALFPLGALVIVAGAGCFFLPVFEALQGRATGLAASLGGALAFLAMLIVQSTGLAVMVAGWLASLANRRWEAAPKDR